MTKPLEFADFVVGDEIGQMLLDVTDKVCAALPGSFPEAEEENIGLELTVATMMQAYLSIVTPRPQGNIHTGMTFSLSGWVNPRDSIRAIARCVSKEQRRSGPRVVFEILLTCGDRDIAKAEMSFLWAQ